MAALVQLDRIVKRALPAALSVLVVALSVVPVPIQEYAVLAPNFALMSVYYWIVHRPDLLPAWGVFLIGLLADALSGGLVGLNAFVLLLVQASIMSQHKVFRGKAFWLVWLAFAIVAFVAQLLAAALGLAFRGGLPGWPIWLSQFALTVALYPALAALMGRIQRLFLGGS